MISKETLK